MKINLKEYFNTNDIEVNEDNEILYKNVYIGCLTKVDDYTYDMKVVYNQPCKNIKTNIIIEDEK